MERTIAIEMKGITKAFQTVVANDHVDLQIYEGEIHALLGENGAGKSTLMNMLSGIYSPDSGDILIGGTKASIQSPADAKKYGIGMIHQHFRLVDVFTAKENIIMGQKGHLLLRAGNEEIMALASKYGMSIDPDKRICDMSVGEKQTVEILKVLYRNAKILIMDEPTSTLTPHETIRLFEIIRKMRDDGCSIIIITHKMQEVLSVSDRVTVLRGGRAVSTFETAHVTPKELVTHMVGRAMDLRITRLPLKSCHPVLEVCGLTAYDTDKVAVMDDISFSLMSGQILGVAGVAGSGQRELCETIAGLYPISSGRITYQGINVIGKSPKEIFKMGISMSFIPEDRLGMGLAGSLDIVDNVILRSYTQNKGPFMDRGPARKRSLEIVADLDIKTPSIHHPVRQLSGGNIQKVLLGREISSSPNVLITAYPTRGLDLGVTHTIYDILNEQKAKGVAILYIGEDLDVLLELSDRIMVLCGGKVVGIVDAATTSREEIGLMMTGSQKEDALS